MADVYIRRDDRRIDWGPVIGGAFLAVASAIVLSLFGTAFATNGATSMQALGAVWEILTPLVATFIGAAVAVRLSGNTRAAFVNAVMVWCLALVGGGLLIALAGFPALTAAGLSLSGLAMVLGLCGGLLGAAVAGRKRAEITAGPRVGMPERPEETYAHQGYVPPPAESPPAEQRH